MVTFWLEFDCHLRCIGSVFSPPFEHDAFAPFQRFDRAGGVPACVPTQVKAAAWLCSKVGRINKPISPTLRSAERVIHIIWFGRNGALELDFLVGAAHVALLAIAI